MKRRTALSLYAAAAILCVAGILTVVVNEVWKGRPLLPEPTPTETAIPQPVGVITNPQGDPSQGVVTGDTSIFWITKFQACGHDRVSEQHPEPAEIGLSYQQFADRHPGYSLIVSSGVLRLERTVQTYCPDHYVIKSSADGTIFVYRNLDGNDKLTVVSKLGFGVDAVPQDYQQYIKDGIAFGSIEEIEGFIESAET